MGPRIAGREVRREVRFAVVMYGGVSLAIYINGVVQELFRMVRATAADPEDDKIPLLSDEKLSDKKRYSTERVYRRLGRILKPAEEDADGRIYTSFVVDILSGSSAGGINAVYLAKALANGQDVDQLSKLWTDEGDLGKLINDEKSVGNIEGLKAQRPPKSLLNGQRMYRKLLEALDGMEETKPSAAGAKSPFVEELDLFVTATDFYGLPVSLRLADGVVEERRHRNVYQLRYSSNLARNDFLAENNPFLAFAARSTSAFPFAFDPIKLADADAMLETAPGYRDLPDKEREPKRWQEFFPAYQKPKELPNRAFVDGGYLDNKPFGYAAEAVASRRSDVPVDRKLIYVEPTPEHLEDRGRLGAVPNAIENVTAAFTLARYETIREDLNRILIHNRLVERVKRIVSGMEDDARDGAQDGPPTSPPLGRTAHRGYRRLKIEALTYEIAGMITRTARIDTESGEFLAVRYLVRAWREAHFPDNEVFLAQYDLAYPLRRLSFVLKKIDQLYNLEDETAQVLANKPETDEQKKAFRDKLIDLRKSFSEVYASLYRTREGLSIPGRETNPLTTVVGGTNLDRKKLVKILEEPTEEARYEKARLMVSGSTGEAVFRDLASALGNHVGPRIECAVARCREILDSPGPDEAPQGFAAIARDHVRHYYDSHERYDTISYPVLYATEIGEEVDEVEVFRISPEDATSLIDERHSDRRKLAGVAMRGFGAFLDRGWRRNDILWGRLDSAERIITMLLPGPAQKAERDKHIQEAQLEILADEFDIQDRDQLLQLLVDAMTGTGSVDQNEATLRELAERELGSPVNPKLQAVLRRSLTGEALLDFFRNSYTVNREPNRQTAVRTLARSTQVTGKMFEGISRDGAGSRPSVWLTRLGRVFSGLAEVSVSRSLPNLIFNNWLVLLYAFELFLIAAGLLSSTQIYRAGLIALVVTAVLHVGVLGLGDYLRGAKRWYLGVPILVFCIAILLLAGLGVYHLFHYTPEAVREVWDELFTLLG